VFFIILFYIFFTATSNDFSPLSAVPLTFSPQSVNGEQICANLTVFADDLVESEENFTVTLDLMTLNEVLTVGNAIAMVTVVDIDGKDSLFLCSTMK
jgi:hypothetical protein